jgi:hypothetical protein
MDSFWPVKSALLKALGSLDALPLLECRTRRAIANSFAPAFKLALSSRTEPDTFYSALDQVVKEESLQRMILIEFLHFLKHN